MLGTDTRPSPQAVPAGVLAQALGAIVTDDKGLVCAVSPGLAELGLDVSGERIGRHWTEIFPSFRRLPYSTGSGDDDFVVITDPERSAYRMTRLALIAGEGDDGGSMLLVRPVSLDGDSTNVAGAYLNMLSSVTEDVGHEVNNALTTITGWTEMLLTDCPKDHPDRQPLETIDHEVARIKEIAQSLVEFGKEPSSEAEPVCVNDVVRTVVAFLRIHAQRTSVALETDLLPAVCLVEANAGKLKQAFLNVMLNALRAMAGGGELRVTTCLSADGKEIEIRFADTGPGIPPEFAPRIFDPHFTTRPGGTGIGLPLSRDLVRKMGGELELEATSDGGSTFLFRLPAAATA